MDLVQKIFEYKICVSYDGKYYVYHEGENDGKTITPKGLAGFADALMFVREHMKKSILKRYLVRRFNMESCICVVCRTQIDWNGGDKSKGNIWCCEECGDTFCEECFVKSCGRDAFLDSLCADGAASVLCPHCYEEKHTEQ